MGARLAGRNWFLHDECQLIHKNRKTVIFFQSGPLPEKESVRIIYERADRWLLKNLLLSGSRPETKSPRRKKRSLRRQRRQVISGPISAPRSPGGSHGWSSMDRSQCCHPPHGPLRKPFAGLVQEQSPDLYCCRALGIAR